MTLIHIWASPGTNDAGPYLGITGTWILSYIPGPHLDLVTVVPPGPHLDEVTGYHRDLVTQVLIWASWDLVFQFHIGASRVPGISGPNQGLIWT